MRELRAISTRAAISRTSFSNHYEYGDLKANPRDLLVNYFDASLYFAHWLHAEVAFRFPKDAVDLRALRRYATEQSLEIKTMASHVVVTMSVEREDFDVADDGADWLSSLVGLRGDIASGDERSLYLAWLLGVQYGQVDDAAVESWRPDGLGCLSPSLASFVDIMGLDRDLVAAAAEGGARIPAAPAARDIDRWLAGLRPDEHVAMLSRVARGDGSVSAEIMRQYRRHARPRPSGLPLRTAAHCGSAPRRWRRRDTRLPGDGRLGLTHGANARSRSPAIDSGRPGQARTPSLAASRHAHWHEASARLRRCRDAPLGPLRCERTERARRPVRAAHQRPARGARNETQSAGTPEGRRLLSAPAEHPQSARNNCLGFPLGRFEPRC